MEFSFIAVSPRSPLTGVVIPDKILFMPKIEQLDHLTVCKQKTDV